MYDIAFWSRSWDFTVSPVAVKIYWNFQKRMEIKKRMRRAEFLISPCSGIIICQEIEAHDVNSQTRMESFSNIQLKAQFETMQLIYSAPILV